MNSNYGKENLSAEQPPPREETRVQSENGDQERARRFEAPPREGTQEIDGPALLGFGLPKRARLRKPREFQRVYKSGKRFDGRFMTVFILPSDGELQRLGITASKKGVGNAVQRNRAKRLLRETFRLSRAELNQINTNFDWVLNARRYLLKVKLEKPLEEFRQIIERVKIYESKNKTGDGDVGIVKET